MSETTQSPNERAARLYCGILKKDPEEILDDLPRWQWYVIRLQVFDSYHYERLKQEMEALRKEIQELKPPQRGNFGPG